MMTAKEYLLQVKDLYIECKRIREHIQRLRDTLDISGVRYDKENVQGTPEADKFSAVFAQIEEYDYKLQKCEGKYIDVRLKVMEMINQCEHSDILYSVYIDFKSLKQSAADLGYCYGYAKSLHHLALMEFEKLLT